MFCSLILVLKTLYLYNDIIHLSYQTPPFSVFLYQYLIILLKKNVGNFKNSDLANKLDSSAIIAQYNKLQIGNVKIQYGKMECIVNFNGQASIVFPEGYSQENLYHCMAVPMSGSYAVRSITNSGNNNSLALLLDSSDTKPEYQSKIWMQYIVIGT